MIAAPQLTLYITGQNALAQSAIRNLQSLKDKCSFEINFRILDVLEDPQVAEEERIIATPLLVAEVGGVQRRLVGDLSDLERVASVLNFPNQPTIA